MALRHRWFLPETPDILGQLRRQCATTTDGLDAFAAWAAGASDRASALAQAEADGDAAKRELLEMLRAAFVTPIDPEDAFALSRGIDRILIAAREVAVEEEVLACGVDDGIAEMARLLAEATRHIGTAIGALDGDGTQATTSADAALAVEKRLDAAYLRGMAALLAVEERSTRIGRRELYRRSARIGDVVVETAERIVYAVVKQS